jgi:hypothetical protein
VGATRPCPLLDGGSTLVAERRDKVRTRALLLIGLAAVGVGTVALRRRQLAWGADPHEVAATLPGDEIVSDPQYVATNAITIRAPAGAVWPWLVQMGAYTRAGWYSFDRLDNGGIPSATRIVPELQHLEVGDVMPTDRDGAGFVVEALEPHRSIVLTIRDPDALTSSAMLLQPASDGQTRLLVRLRLRARPTLSGARYRAIMELGHVPMTLRMLHGIRGRVEGHATVSAAAGVPQSAAHRRQMGDGGGPRSGSEALLGGLASGVQGSADDGPGVSSPSSGVNGVAGGVAGRIELVEPGAVIFGPGLGHRLSPHRRAVTNRDAGSDDRT